MADVAGLAADMHGVVATLPVEERQVAGQRPDVEHLRPSPPVIAVLPRRCRAWNSTGTSLPLAAWPSTMRRLSSVP